MHRVAILGAGIGAQHVDGFLELPQSFKIAVICDQDAKRAQSLAARVPDCAVATDVNAVIADVSIDIIDICLPPHLHAPVTHQALAAGKHVICEKPMATSVLEADALARAAAQSQRTLTPIFQYRYGYALTQLDHLCDAGLTGKPLVATLETHWNRGSEYYAADWRGTWAHERGGAVLGHAIHIHDLIGRYFGRIVAVTSMLDTRVNPIETEDCAALAMRTDAGGLVTSSITLGSANDQSRLRLIFENLSIESGLNPYRPGQDHWQFTARNPKDQPHIDAVTEAVPKRRQGYAGQFDALAAHLQGKPAKLVTAADGVRSIELVAAIYLAAGERRHVSLPLERTLPVCSDWTPHFGG